MIARTDGGHSTAEAAAVRRRAESALRAAGLHARLPASVADLDARLARPYQVSGSDAADADARVEAEEERRRGESDLRAALAGSMRRIADRGDYEGAYALAARAEAEIAALRRIPRP